MNLRLYPYLFFVLCMVFLADHCFGADESHENTGVGCESGECSADQGAEEKEPSKWFLLVGAANVQPRLEMSEAQIDRQLNTFLASCMPGWREPRTFRDWKNELRLWDFHFGFGRELGDKFTWGSTVGGTLGTVRNSDRYYPLGIPTGVNVDFSRRLWFVSTGISYSPWGRAEYVPGPDGKPSFVQCLKSARPFVAGVVGYINLMVEAVAEVDLPITSRDPRIVQKDHLDLFYVSPRVGVDIPLSKRSEAILAAGYLFFDKYPEEYNNMSYYLIYKYKL